MILVLFSHGEVTTKDLLSLLFLHLNTRDVLEKKKFPRKLIHPSSKMKQFRIFLLEVARQSFLPLMVVCFPGEPTVIPAVLLAGTNQCEFNVFLARLCFPKA